MQSGDRVPYKSHSRGRFLRPFGPRKHRCFHSPYAWAELAFFALLAFSNLTILINGLKLRRSSVTPPIEPLSWWSILVIPVTLVIFLSVPMLYILSI